MVSDAEHLLRCFKSITIDIGVDTLPQSVVEAIAFNKLLKENLAAKFSFCFSRQKNT